MKCNVLRRNNPTANQRKILKSEVKKEFDKLLEDFIYAVNIQTLFILRESYGFGQKRLEEYIRKFNETKVEILKRYECDEADINFLCEYKLKEDKAIDFDRLLGLLKE